MEVTIVQLIPDDLAFANVSYLAIHLIDSCNLQCSYCYVDATKHSSKRKIIDLEFVSAIIKSVCKNSKNARIKILLTGGEPLLVGNTKLKCIIDLAKEQASKFDKELDFALTTNGVLLGPSTANFLQQENIGACVSLDGPSEIHNKSRGSATKVLAGIKALKDSGASINTICILNEHNIDSIDDILNQLHTLNIRRGKISLVEETGRALSNKQSLDQSKISEVMIKIIEYMINTKARFFIDLQLARSISLYCDFIRGNSAKLKEYDCYSKTCWSGKGYIAIDLNGDLYPCSRVLSGEFRVGNILTGIEQERFNEVMSLIHTKGIMYYNCAKCIADVICTRGCPVNYFNNQQYFDLTCSITKNLFNFFEHHQKRILLLDEQLRERMNENCAIKPKDLDIMYLSKVLELTDITPLEFKNNILAVQKGNDYYMLDTSVHKSYQIGKSTVDFISKYQA